MHRNSTAVLLCISLIFGISGLTSAKDAPWDPDRARGPLQTAIANPQMENRVHNAGKMWMNFTNFGYFGNNGPQQSDAMTDPCPPGSNWAPQCEFPGGTGQNYLFQAGLWIGALIDEEGFQTKRVSVGTDGWFSPTIREFFPGEGLDDGIQERSTRPGFSNCLGEFVSHPDAVSDQDFIAVMADTLHNESLWNENDPIDGPHRPLGIKITQTSYSFSQAFAEDFILIDYEIENIASNFLKNLYVGLYVDSDTGPFDQFEHHTDDVCGFVRSITEEVPGGAPGDSITIPIDVAWIADNDGRPPAASSGAFDNPHVTGTRVIRAPNPRLKTSFNWWISNGDVDLDFGPAWEAYAERDSNGLGWTEDFGTPVGDVRKYQILSNCEFDYWQTSVVEASQGLVPPDSNCFPDLPQSWTDQGMAGNAPDLADGFDTRYLLSWGPLGVFDFTDASGQDIYRLNPGEKFKMTIAYIGGEFFHDPGNPQPSNTNIDSSLFNFTDLKNNARWAKDVYDNRMFDSPQWDWGNDGDPLINDQDGSQGDNKLDTGDGWFGEDVGADGLYAILPPGEDSVAVVYFRGTQWETDTLWYRGPDEGERDGRVTPLNSAAQAFFDAQDEDHIVPRDMIYLGGRDVPLSLGFWDMGWMNGNNSTVPDFGDGIPDFTGPPPPPIPAMMDCLPNTKNSASHFGGIVREGCYRGGLGYELVDNEVILRWSKRSSEDTTYRDPFSRLQDFEGYRVHVANVRSENEFELQGQWDQIDYSYFASGDSMMTVPIVTNNPDTLPPCITISGITGCLQPVGLNTGFGGETKASSGKFNIVMNDSTYEFRIPAHPLAPRYYAVTAFDYGDPQSGLTSLTTRATSNAVLLATAGTPKEPVRVVPNPYRAYQDYTADYLGIQWENQNDGTQDFFPQVDRRIEFMNLPEKCLIRVFTTSGDLVQIVPHNVIGDASSWASATSEKWDLNSRNRQQVVSGIYMFSVEDMEDHSVETGKFVIIR